MKQRTVAALTALGLVASPAAAQRSLLLPIGTDVPLITVDALSSKTNVKGDLVRLKTSADIAIGGTVAIPAGTPATGQIVDARAKGAMGMSGRLVVRPLYLTIGSTTVRLSGASGKKATVTAGAVIGTVALGMPVFTGRSASIAPGAPIAGMVERTTTIPGI